LQQILGHSDSKVTERYAHLSTKALQEAAKSVSAKIEEDMRRKTG
jgi:site-specific recombinase XerD